MRCLLLLDQCLVQAEAAALIADSLRAIQSVLANRGSAALQQLECRPLQAAAHQFRKRIRPLFRLPSWNWYQQTLLCQIALKTRADRPHRAEVALPAY